MPPRSSPLRVLLVDDENYMRVFVSRILNLRLSCTVSLARDGQEALALCRTQDPELIFLDINMPRVDGLQALSDMRAVAPSTPIIMLTSISEEAVVEECVQRGASGFIRKDVAAGTLKTEIENVLLQFFPEDVKSHEQPQTR